MLNNIKSILLMWGAAALVGIPIIYLSGRFLGGRDHASSLAIAIGLVMMAVAVGTANIQTSNRLVWAWFGASFLVPLMYLSQKYLAGIAHDQALVFSLGLGAMTGVISTYGAVSSNRPK